MEYVILRLLRKFLFNEKFLYKFGKYLPYYNPSVNEINPQEIIFAYKRLLGLKGIRLDNLDILDIGSGATNSIGYALLMENINSITLYEPYAIFNSNLDSQSFNQLLKNNEILKSRLKREKNIHDIVKKFDLILSYSVLEHVECPEQLFSNLKELLKPNGKMLHICDFRDHFFKYPYHFLKYSKNTWNNFLNPGDLHRWRKYDYTYIFDKLGLKYEVLEENSKTIEFEKIKPQISKNFDIGNPDLSIGYCVFYISQ